MSEENMLHLITIARNPPGHVSNYESSSDNSSVEEKPFFQDTAEKMGVSPRAVERHVRINEKLMPETMEILRDTDAKITRQNLTKLSRLKPEQQTEAAEQLTGGTIKSFDEYTAGARGMRKIIIVLARLSWTLFRSKTTY